VVIPEPSYNLQAGVASLALLAGAGAHNTVLAVTLGALAAFLTFQATNVKFRFDDEALEVLIATAPGEGANGDGSESDGKESENVFVGGRNRWNFDTFTNWEMWWPQCPILVYFKETQTKPEGQIHFFPIIMNGKQLYNVMVERCGKSQNSLPE